MKREEVTASAQNEIGLFEFAQKSTAKRWPAGCMRFLWRFALLGALLLLFILALALQQHSFAQSRRFKNNESKSQESSADKPKETGPTAEDKEIRRLLLLAAGIAPDEGVVVPAAISGSNGGGGSSQQLETAVGAGLLFPIGRYPQGGRPGGVGPVLTLNVAVVLVVSLLSIAVLITAICCVIIIALAMDSATSVDGSITPCRGGSSHAAEFLLSNWPNLMLNGPDVGGGGNTHLGKFSANSAHFNMTPPLTDDDIDDDEEAEATALMAMDVEDLESGIARGHCVFSQQSFNDQDRLVLLDETEQTERSWPVKF